jgi:hypothetical protein
MYSRRKFPEKDAGKVPYLAWRVGVAKDGEKSLFQILRTWHHHGPTWQHLQRKICWDESTMGYMWQEVDHHFKDMISNNGWHWGKVSIAILGFNLVPVEDGAGMTFIGLNMP